MRTQLGSYCQQFDGTVRPVLDDLTNAIHALDVAAPDIGAKGLQPAFAGLHHDLGALCDKVREQQAYVLIFGPLKSGKSTLMNAIAAAYVSEVSSLPAYPCLVFVSAGAKREFVATSYNGTQKSFSQPADLHLHIERAHQDLAAAIRDAEQRGVVFDPQEHFPAAIRRVDVRVPDSELATDSTVLVDTPGLYTRMRFGYDRMTKDFRNAAACAIFVVKSDTLFLEQVFAEFQQLLDLFSRIFLVVNVDTKKVDVGPDGKLLPSLEQSEPEAVLRAFEQLAMSAPLQQAAREGRVRMYPVDLLHAASAVLQKQPADRLPEGYRAFRKDLSEYLASQAYVAAFLRDSLQRGHSLLGETVARATGNEAHRLGHAIAEIDEQIAFVDAEQKRTERALQLDWTETFARPLREIEAELERAARDQGAKLLRTLGASIDTWFLSSHSLEWLTTGQWVPLVRDYREDVLQAGRRVFEQQQQQLDAALALPDGIPELIRRAGIDPRRLRQHVFAELGGVDWGGDTSVPVHVDQIPVKKGVLDLVTLRSHDRVRQHLFGSNTKPERKIPGKEKAARLGEPGRLHLHQCVAQFRGDLVPKTVAALRDWFGPRFQQAAIATMQKGLAAYLPALAQKRGQLVTERARLDAVAAPLRAVATSAQALQQRLSTLRTQFDRDALTEPAVVLEPQTRKPTPKATPTKDTTPRSQPRR